MLNSYVRLAIIPLALFTAALLLIRAQPYDNHDLRQLLPPVDCRAPCFMGIRPGVTTRHEVVELLKASNQLEIKSSNWDDDDSDDPILLLWSKNKSYPIGRVSQLTIAFQNAEPKKVAQIIVDLQREVTLSDFYLTFGTPSRYLGSITATNSRNHRYGVRILYLYDQYKMSLLAISDCPINLGRLLQWPIGRIEYDAQMRVDGTKPMRSFRANALCL